MAGNGQIERGRHGLDDRGRDEVVARLRRQVEAGDYDPPVEEVVDRLVLAVLAHHGPSPAGRRP